VFAFRRNAVLSFENLQFYRLRERQCRAAAAEAIDRSARRAQLALAEFYRRRLQGGISDPSDQTNQDRFADEGNSLWPG
jgi:hypothetical protein